MNKKVVSVLLVLVLGGGIGYYFYSKKAVPTQEDVQNVEKLEEDFNIDDLPTEMPSFEDEIEDESPALDTNAVEVDTLEMAV